MSLHVTDMYERFPLYDAGGFQVAWGVRKAQQDGVTVCRITRQLDPHAQYNDIKAHIDLMTQARADQL